MNGGPATRRRLWRFLGWFIAANAGLCCLVSLRYLLAWNWPQEPLGIAYAPLATVGHFTLVAALALALLPGLLVAVAPLRRTVLALAIVVAALMLALLVLDTNIWAERRLHLGLLVAALFEPATWVATGLVFVIAVVFEAMLARLLWRWLASRPAAGGRWLAAALAGSWIASQGIHVWADAVGYTPVMRFTQVLPLYYPQTGKRQLARLGLVDPERVREARLQRRSAGAAAGDGELHYPLAPLRCTGGHMPMNLLWIVIDALRPDAVDAALTPVLAGFRDAGQHFAEHWSPGNSSRMAAFGMFYGLPANYFQSFYVAARPPLLVERFQAQGYEIRAASGKGFGSPTQMDRTAFAGVAALDSAEALPRLQGNRAVAGRMAQWLGARATGRPFFAFLWLDHSDADHGLRGRLPPDDRFAGRPEAAARWDLYRRGLREVDGQVGRVLEALAATGEEAHTVVLVMGDHGFEFDELGLGYWGHASNYAHWQLRTPLYAHWPDRGPRVYRHRTSHLDLPATLLSELFGCENPPSDFGMGRNLFAGESWEWIIAGS